MKKFLLGIALSFLTSVGFSQQDPLYSQYILNPFVLNPAYAGITNNLNTSVSYRQQWVSLPGSPSTFNANAHISLAENKVGAGLMIVSDHIGSATTNDIVASGSYRIHLSKDKILSFGLQAGVTNFQVDNSKVNPYDTSDPLFQGKTSETKPTLGVGIILKDDKFFVGLSVPHMLSPTFQTGNVQSTLYTQHYYLMGSYLFFINEKIQFKPSALLKMVSGAPASVDLNASFIFQGNYQAGLLTRNFNTYGLFLQMVIKDSFRIGYVFEVPTGASVGTSFSTHEITLGYRIKVLGFHSNSSVLGF